MDHIKSSDVAHGLQPHSVGDTYPVIVIGIGNGPEVSYGVELHGESVEGLTNLQAHDLAQGIVTVYREHGKAAALETLNDVREALN